MPSINSYAVPALKGMYFTKLYLASNSTVPFMLWTLREAVAQRPTQEYTRLEVYLTMTVLVVAYGDP